MNTDRRQFIAGLFSILPAATCYKRVWKEIVKQPAWILNPDWEMAYEINFAPWNAEMIARLHSGVAAGDPFRFNEGERILLYKFDSFGKIESEKMSNFQRPASITPPTAFPRKGDQTATRNAIRDYYRKKFDPEGKQRRPGFRFAKRPSEKPVERIV